MKYPNGTKVVFTGLQSALDLIAEICDSEVNISSGVVIEDVEEVGVTTVEWDDGYVYFHEEEWLDKNTQIVS